MRLKDKLKNKKYRDSLVMAHIETGLPFQIRALREERGWSQRQLGIRLNTPRASVSRIESPGRGLALKTLLRLASAFDVALIVRFVPFSELVNWVGGLGPGALRVADFEHDPGFSNNAWWPSLVSTTSPPETQHRLPVLPIDLTPSCAHETRGTDEAFEIARSATVA